jgi:hypothetical protein
MSSSVAHQMADACRMNNEGAEHFCKGRRTQALAAFSLALECIIALESIVGRENEYGIVTFTQDPGDLVELKRHIGVTDDMLDSSMSEGDGAPFLFDKPFVVKEPLRYTHASSLAVSGLIVFNMAIACHANGIGGDTSSYSKSLQLYDSSIGFFNAAPYGNTIFAGVISAALNNKVHIYLDDFRFDELERDMEWLSEAVAIAYRDLASDSIVKQADLEGVFMNVLLMRRPVMAVAA